MAPVRWLAALALAACAGCTTPVPVLQIPEIRDCALARISEEGAPCAFTAPCLWTEPASGGGCCANRATCNNRRLSLDNDCAAACQTCGRDVDCPFGATFCVHGPEFGECAPCLPTGPCPSCPAGWVPLTRNGCPSCECAPPSQCDIFTPGSCPSPNRCYIGQRCAEGCSGPDPCCVNVCSGGDCIPIVWEGCPVACKNLACGECMLEQCQCMPGGTWACRERCIAPGSVRTCQVPPHPDIVIIP
jgi:hypothetical protein